MAIDLCYNLLFLVWSWIHMGHPMPSDAPLLGFHTINLDEKGSDHHLTYLTINNVVGYSK